MTGVSKGFQRLFAGSRRAAALAVGAMLFGAAGPAEAQSARNVILFIGDAGGLPTLSAAGIYAHDRPQSLFIQSMPNVGLSDTSALNRWVTDSAAGMTAVVTGHKTNNGMNSVVPSPDGSRVVPVKTILEYAEQRGLSTGVITNMPFWDATPAACYAHVAKRSDKDSIINQFFAPRFGNGPEILIGKDRQALDQVVAPDSQGALFSKHGYRFAASPAELTPDMTRAISITDTDFDPQRTVEAAVGSLSRNPKGYFLMVEWDMHANDLRRGLTHAIEMDNLIRRISQVAGKDTLILFVADHSYNLKLLSGTRDRPLAEQIAADTPGQPSPIAADPKGAHAGEEVVATAMGPGAERVRGFFPNTRLFDIMMSAFGWKPER